MLFHLLPQKVIPYFSLVSLSKSITDALVSTMLYPTRNFEVAVVIAVWDDQ
ncbi:hypothetical protein U9M48_022730 [Paspalum notatum var. saurae]|uniref:Uncharacterized protein n=1 Tax=Paspalum notatum var. saurae TaxID=547442 RepID=A0AAQ3WTW6_PASNO